MREIDLVRTNPLVDPHLHVWGWEVPVYLFLGGLAAGVMILTALLGRQAAVQRRSTALRWLPWAAPLALSVGMGALLLDLENPANVWRFYTRFRPTSPMSWGAWILLAVYPVSALLALIHLSDGDLARLGRPGRLLAGVRTWAQQREASVRSLAVVLGLALGAYTGILLGAAGMRPAWSSAVLAPLFLVSGTSAGAAFLLLFPLSDGERHLLGRWDRLAIAAELALLALYLFALATGGAGQQAVADLVLGGRLTALFWSLVVVAGLLVPWTMGWIEARQHRPPAWFAAVLVLAGSLALRWVVVAAGQA